MKAMMLAAGVGRRLQPLTLTMPKPSLPVLGRPIAVQILRRLARQGIEQAVLNLHHLPRLVRVAMADGAPCGLPALAYTEEDPILGTAGGIRNAAHLLRDSSPIVVANSDFLCDFDLGALVETHRRSGRSATLVLTAWRPGYSVVEVDAEGGILSLAGKPPVDPSRVAGNYLFTGLHCFDPGVLEEIPDRVPSSIVSDVYRGLAAEGRLGYHLHEGFWWEFGSPELYLEGSLLLLGRQRAVQSDISDEHDPIRRLGDSVAAVGPATVIHPSARFEGRAALGFASHVSEQALIRDSIVMPEAWIGPRCRIQRSVVAHGVELPAGFEADEMLICADATPDLPPPTGSRRHQGLLVRQFVGQPAP